MPTPPVPPQPSSAVSIGISINQSPFWMITYMNGGREWILHPCSRCGVMVSVEKRGRIL